jgi:peroxiredoxin
VSPAACVILPAGSKFRVARHLFHGNPRAPGRKGWLDGEDNDNLEVICSKMEVMTLMIKKTTSRIGRPIAKQLFLVPALAVMITMGLASLAAGGREKRPQSSDSGPAIGQPAPDFGLPWATGEAMHFKPDEFWKLSDQRGSNVILAFYPADWSGGCTTEVCSFRDNWGDLSKLNAKLVGISGDYVFSHKEWITHHKLTFPLLSDHDHAVSKQYASFNPGVLGGINNRTVYLIDKNGTVRYKNLKFNAGAKSDYDTLRAELTKLQDDKAAH